MYFQVSRSSYLNVAISLLTPSNSFFCSTGKRASDKLLEQVHDFIISLGNEWAHERKRRGEILYISTGKIHLMCERSPVTLLGQISSEESVSKPDYPICLQFFY